MQLLRCKQLLAPKPHDCLTSHSCRAELGYYANTLTSRAKSEVIHLVTDVTPRLSFSSLKAAAGSRASLKPVQPIFLPHRWLPMTTQVSHSANRTNRWSRSMCVCVCYYVGIFYNNMHLKNEAFPPVRDSLLIDNLLLTPLCSSITLCSVLTHILFIPVYLSPCLLNVPATPICSHQENC